MRLHYSRGATLNEFMIICLQFFGFQLFAEIEADEFSAVLKGERVPKVLISTCRFNSTVCYSLSHRVSSVFSSAFSDMWIGCDLNEVLGILYVFRAHKLALLLTIYSSGYPYIFCKSGAHTMKL